MSTESDPQMSVRRINAPCYILLATATALAVGCSQTKSPRQAPQSESSQSESAAKNGSNNRTVDDAASDSTMTLMPPVVDENDSFAHAARRPTPAPLATPNPKPPASDQPSPPPVQETPPAPEGNRVSFAPGIVIDWSIPRVEIEAEVALPEGPIELLLCSRGTKEHESVLVTDASPQRVFEALGLIGMTPGSPARYDEATGKSIPPSGDRVAIEIEYNEQVVPAHEWVVSSDSLEPVGAIPWVFAGSNRIQQQFGADVDGTIICVVDFDTALIAPAESHSADNAELWLAVNRNRVLPKGAPCRLHLRPMPSGDVMELTVTPEGQFHWNKKLLTPIELDEIIRARVQRNPDQKVRLKAVPGTDPRLARVAARCIVGSGIKQQQLTLELPEDNSPDPQGP